MVEWLSTDSNAVWLGVMLLGVMAPSRTGLGIAYLIARGLVGVAILIGRMAHALIIGTALAALGVRSLWRRARKLA